MLAGRCLVLEWTTTLSGCLNIGVMKYTADQQYYSNHKTESQSRGFVTGKCILLRICNTCLWKRARARWEPPFQFLWGHFQTIQRTRGIAFRWDMPLTNTCLRHLPQIIPSYFPNPWEKKKIQTISSGCQFEQLGSGILLGLNKRARAPTLGFTLHQ